MIGDADFWSGIGGTALISIVTSSAVSAVIQIVLKARYDRKLAEKVAALGRQNSADLARLTSDLTRDSTREIERFKQRYTLLATRQISTIEEVHRNLVVAHSTLLQLVNPTRLSGGPDEDQLLTELHNVRWDGYSHFRQARLYLPPHLADQVDEIYLMITHSEVKFGTMVRATAHKPHDWERQSEIWDRAKGEIETTLRGLEASFRQIVAGEVG